MKTLGRLAALLFGFAAAPAFAAITCSVMVTAIATVYDPTVVTDNVSTGSYAISCTRLAGDPNSLTWSLGAHRGPQSGGGNHRAPNPGGPGLAYRVYRPVPYTNANRLQDGGGTRFTGT